MDSNHYPPEAVTNVNRVFTTLRVTYPAWYEKYYGQQKTEQLAKRIWLTGMIGLTEQQINQGLQRMVLECDFPPKLKDFVALCKRVEGVPSLQTAWAEALMGRYTHPITRVAAALTGIFELRSASYENNGLKARFEHYFEQVVENYAQGKPLKTVQPNAVSESNLLAQVEQQATKQIVARIKQQGIHPTQARAQCLAMLGIKRS